MQFNKIEDVVLMPKINHKKYYKWLRNIVALANHDGGIIYFGISKNGEIHIINKIYEEINFINNKIIENISPKIDYKVNKCLKDNKEVIELIVLKSKKIVYLKNENKELVLYLRKQGKTITANYNDIENIYDGSNIVKYTIKASTTKYKETILDFCQTPKSRQEIQEHIGVASRPYFRENILLC